MFFFYSGFYPSKKVFFLNGGKWVFFKPGTEKRIKKEKKHDSAYQNWSILSTTLMPEWAKYIEKPLSIHSKYKKIIMHYIALCICKAHLQN